MRHQGSLYLGVSWCSDQLLAKNCIYCELRMTGLGSARGRSLTNGQPLWQPRRKTKQSCGWPCFSWLPVLCPPRTKARPFRSVSSC
jgi:hypothetical protein